MAQRYKVSIDMIILSIHNKIGFFHKNKLIISYQRITREIKMVEGVGLEPTNPMGADLQSAAFGQLRYPSTLKNPDGAGQRT